MKTKTVILLLLFLIYISAEDKHQNEDFQNQSTENKNQHQPQTDRPFILTYNFGAYKWFENNNQVRGEQIRLVIEKALKVVKKFLADLLRVKVQTEDFYIPKMNEFKVNQYNDFNNIDEYLESDLRIIFSFARIERSDFFKMMRGGRLISFNIFRQKNNIPTHVEFKINTFTRDYEYNDEQFLYNAIQYELIQAIFQTFFQSIAIKSNRQLDTIEYVYSNLKEMAVQHFNCHKLIGFPLIHSLRVNQLLQPKPFENEISGDVYNRRQQPFLSKFTLALLKSTNFFTYINENMIEDYTHGKDAGCQIFDDYYQDDREKQNVQINFDKFSDFTIGNFEDYHFDYVVENKSLFSKQSFQYKCDHVSNQLLVKLQPDTEHSICSYNNQILYFHDESCDCTRDFLCPGNIKEFCSFKKGCSNTYCSQNGYCNNEVCNCIANYSGDGCEIYTPPIDNTPPIEKTSPIENENENESDEENTEQPSDP